MFQDDAVLRELLQNVGACNGHYCYQVQQEYWVCADNPSPLPEDKQTNMRSPSICVCAWNFPIPCFVIQCTHGHTTLMNSTATWGYIIWINMSSCRVQTSWLGCVYILALVNACWLVCKSCFKWSQPLYASTWTLPPYCSQLPSLYASATDSIVI